MLPENAVVTFRPPKFPVLASSVRVPVPAFAVVEVIKFWVPATSPPKLVRRTNPPPAPMFSRALVPKAITSEVAPTSNARMLALVASPIFRTLVAEDLLLKVSVPTAPLVRSKLPRAASLAPAARVTVPVVPAAAPIVPLPPRLAPPLTETAVPASEPATSNLPALTVVAPV